MANTIKSLLNQLFFFTKQSWLFSV